MLAWEWRGEDRKSEPVRRRTSKLLNLMQGAVLAVYRLTTKD